MIEQALTEKAQKKNLSKKIAVYGGTFDPFHKAHHHVIDEIKRLTTYDHIICVPTGQNPLKSQHPMANGRQRMKMIELACQNKKYLSISDFEIRATNEPSYTIDTITHIRETYAITERIGLIVGVDIFDTILQWKFFESLADYVILLVVPRPHYNEVAQFKEVAHYFQIEYLEQFTPMDIEAHVLRNNISLLYEHIDEAVKDYIIRENLYR